MINILLILIILLLILIILFSTNIIMNYIDDEVIHDSDSDIDDPVDNHLNFSVPDSYVEIKS